MVRIGGMTFAAVLIGLAGTARAFEPVVEWTVANPSKPMISGTSNLPNGTPLMVTVLVARVDAANPGHIIYPMMGEDAVEVRSGHFQAGPFSNHGDGYDRGTYVVTIAIARLALPENAQSILGETGEKMGGPNVKASATGPYFEVRRSFEIK